MGFDRDESAILSAAPVPVQPVPSDARRIGPHGEVSAQSDQPAQVAWNLATLSRVKKPRGRIPPPAMNWKTTPVAETGPHRSNSNRRRSLVAFLEQPGDVPACPRLRERPPSRPRRGRRAASRAARLPAHLGAGQHAHRPRPLAVGQADVAVPCGGDAPRLLHKHRHRMTTIEAEDVDYSNPMNRPHIRFGGRTLSELEEKWGHAQPDALGCVGCGSPPGWPGRGVSLLTADQRDDGAGHRPLLGQGQVPGSRGQRPLGGGPRGRGLEHRRGLALVAGTWELDAFLGESGRRPRSSRLGPALAAGERGKQSLGPDPAGRVRAEGQIR